MWPGRGWKLLKTRYLYRLVCTRRQPAHYSILQLGAVHPQVKETRVSSAGELDALIARCLSYRKTSRTARNATSSRSHAVLRIRVVNTSLPQADNGQLLLVEYDPSRYVT